MSRRGSSIHPILWGVAIALAASLLACSAGPAPQVATLQQQVASQATRIAALEVRVAALQPAAVAQGTRIVVLETRVAAPQAAVAQAKPTSSGTTPTAQPTPTIIPAVAGLTSAGNTKGPATAKVTITEYTDYL